MSGNKNGERKGAGGTLAWLCTKEWVPTKRVQMVRARLNWDPKVGDSPEGTEEEEEGWEEATEVPVSRDRGEEPLPSSERRQLTTVTDVYHYTDDILLTAESPSYF